MVQFDPYHKWLGIPRDEQPANHYRLLGIALFETDPEVIEAAADRQMKYVAQCATGSYLKESQQLLNELAAAKVCLLVPARRKVYDAELQRKQDESQRLERSMVPLVLNEPEPSAPRPVPELKPRHVTAPPAKRRKPKSVLSARRPVLPSRVMAIVTAIAVVLLVGGFGIRSMLVQRRDTAASRPTDPSTVAAVEAAQPSMTEPAEAEQIELPPAKASVPIVEAVPAGPLPDEVVVQKTEPGLPEQELARKAMLDRFKNEFTAATTSAARVGLARALVEKSATANDDAERFVLLTEGLTLAAQGDDFDLAIDIVKRLTTRFQVDPLVWRARAAIALGTVKQPWTPTGAAILFERLVELANEAAVVDEYTLAADVMRAAVARLQEPGNQLLHADALFLLKHFETWRDAFAAARNSRDTLLTDPTDPKANLIWGRFVSFYRQDRDSGLRMIARADDAVWAPIARQELDVPTSASEWLALGDAWRKAGAVEPDPVRTIAADRADQAWRQALEIASDDERKKIEQDVDQKIVKLFGPSFVRTKNSPAGSTIANSEPFSPSDSFTIEAWVSTIAEKGTLLSKRHLPGQPSIIVHLDRAVPNLSIAIGGGERGSGSGALINDGKWHHLALVKRQDVITLFIDGNQTVQTQESMDSSSSSPWKFGCSDGRPPCAARFGGLRISKVARYDGPFTPQKFHLSDKDTLLQQ